MTQLPIKQYTHFANHVYHHEIGLKLSVDKLISDLDKDIWNTSLSNEFVHLAQEVRKDRISGKYIKVTNTIFFIPKSQAPPYAKVAYANFICATKTLKTKNYRVRITVDGNKLDYDVEPSSPAISLFNTKIFLNSIISDVNKGSSFSTVDIHNHYLQSPIKSTST